MKNTYVASLVFIICFGLMTCFFPNQVFQANQTYFGFKEDGLKNYYVLDYHLKYDSNALHFQGLNYPFGEHVVFTDGQPLLSLSLWMLTGPFPGIAKYTVGIMNLLMVFGVCWAALLLFRIFRHFEVNEYLAGVAAILLALMAPQMLRITLHYALAYTFFIPWLIYRLLLFADNPNWKNSLAIIVVMLLALGLHLYYLLILGFLLGVFYMLSLFNKESKLTLKTALVHLTVQAVAPLILFMLFMHVSDPVPDRPTAPYGMMEFRALWEGVFLPLEMPAGQWLQSNVKVRSYSFEAIAYVGLPASFFFLFWLISTVSVKCREKLSGIPKQVKTLFLATFIVFLFAAIFPLLFEFSSIAALAGPLKQFRSMGRLSWLLFYGINIFLIIFLDKLLKQQFKVVVLASVLLLGTECFIFVRQISQNSGYLKQAYLLPEMNNAGRVAIFPVPYFHNGSENLGTPTSELYMAERTMELSLQSGLPTFGVLLSRVSISQTLQQLELAMNLSGPLMLVADTWLLVQDTTFHDPVADLLRKSTSKLMLVSPYFVSRVGVNEVREILTAEKQFYSKQEADSVYNSTIISQNHLNDGDAIGLSGRGKQLNMQENHELFNINNYQGFDSIRFVFWLKADADGLRGYKVVFKQHDTSIAEKHYRLEWCYSNVVNGFVRIEIAEKPIQGKSCTLELQYDRPDITPQTVLDELMIIKDGFNYAYTEGNFLFTRDLVYY